MATRRKEELTILHPIVETWLAEHGYEWKHHVRLHLKEGRGTSCGYKIADFIANHPKSGECLLIEVKTTKAIKTELPMTLRQLEKQYLYLRDTRFQKVIAAPETAITDKIREQCTAAEVVLLPIPIPVNAKPIVSRCTGRIPVPSDPNVPWTPEMLAHLFAPERRHVWGEVVALTAQAITERDDDAKTG